MSSFFFFFNDTATTEIYTLSLHDALPISISGLRERRIISGPPRANSTAAVAMVVRSEEHTSELQSQSNLVCRLLLEKKKKRDRDSEYTLGVAESSNTYARSTNSRWAVPML